jgi:hypothetical protein
MRTTHPELKDLPYADIADVYREWPEADWLMAIEELLRRIRALLETHEDIVIEGYFLPGTPSARILLSDLAVAGVQYDIITLHAEHYICRKRILNQNEVPFGEAKGRIALLEKTWKPYA